MHHPNVCPVYDLFFFETPHGPIAAATMPRLRGETLAARLARGPTTPGEAMSIAAGIDALHRARIVHRDLGGVAFFSEIAENQPNRNLGC